MNGDKKVILHLVFDGILFDRVYPRFEEMEKYENRYLFNQLGKNRVFKYIKKTDKLIIADTLEEWGRVVSNPDVDFTTLRADKDKVDFIRPNVMVMWWCYGMEIYENVNKWPPLLPLRIYKPKTHWFLIRNSTLLHIINIELSYSFPKLYFLLISFYNILKGNRRNRLLQLLSRIDYAFTPLSTELDEIKRRHSFIKAKPFVLRGKQDKEPLDVHDRTGCILLEHSANTTNNHLDIIASIKKKKIDLNERDIYIPLSYGEKIIADRVKNEAKFEGANVHCLMDPLPFDKYSAMMNSCTHAIYGMVRQSGLGNIYLCFQKGIKVFFFKDSILYKHFKTEGFYVFSIEDDLDDNSIREPLLPDQALCNYEKFYLLFNNIGSYQLQFDNILKDK